MTDPLAQPADRTGDRPRQVSWAAILLVVFGSLSLMLAMRLLSIANDEADLPAWISWLIYGQFVLAGVQILSGVFVYHGRPWARTVATVVCGINLGGAVLSLVSGAIVPAITSAVVNVALLRLLRGSEVTAWCDR
jgi:hypothetical protein